MMDAYPKQSSSSAVNKKNLQQVENLVAIRTSPGFTKSYKTPDSRHFKKTGMVKASILKYLTKRNVVENQQPQPQQIKRSHTRDSCVQTEMDDDVCVPERCESPDIEYIGTYPRGTNNPTPPPQQMPVTFKQEHPPEIIVISSRSTSPVAVVPNARNSSSSNNNNNGNNNNVNGSSSSYVLTPNNNIPSSTEESSLAKGSLKNNIITSNNTSTIITELPSLQNTRDSENSSVSPSRSLTAEEKENNNVEKNNQNHSNGLVQNQNNNGNNNSGSDNESESVMNSTTNLTCHVMLSKDNKNSDPSALQFLHKPSPSTLPSLKRKSVSDDDENEIEPVECRLNNKIQKTQYEQQANNSTGDIEIIEQCNNVVSPSKSIRSRRLSAGAASDSSSSSKRKKAETELDFAALVDKRRFEEALKQAIGQLENFPASFQANAEQLCKILFNCVLSRHNPGRCSLAIKFFELLVQRTPWSTEVYNVFIKTFTTEYAACSNDSLLLIQLLNDMKEDSKKVPEEKYKFQFFKVLTALVEKDYNCYKRQNVKLRYPIAVSLMEPPHKFVDIKYNQNWKTFVQRITEYSPESEEVREGLKWLTIISSYYKNTRITMESFNQLREEFVTCLCNRRDLRDLGLQFIKLLNFNPFALDVCTHIIRNKLSRSEDDEKWNKILYELSANIQPASTSSTLVTSNNSRLPTTQEDKEFLDYITTPNAKGETRLHKACARKQKFLFRGEKINYQFMLKRMKDRRIGDINITDAALNTVLHDCAFHDRGQVLLSIWEHFTDQNDPSGRVNVTAQNVEGDTALHIAVKNKSKTCIAPLLLMAKILGQEAELLCVRNNCGQKALDLISDDDEDEEIRNLIVENSSISTKKRRTMYAGVDLSDCISEIDSPSVQALINHWRNLYDLINPKKFTQQLHQVDYMMSNIENNEDEDEGVEEDNGEDGSSISISS